MRSTLVVWLPPEKNFRESSRRGFDSLRAHFKMNIIFVRHGESEHNAKVTDKEDSKLTEKGIKQAEAVGKKLRKYNISTIYTSNLLRAKETGEIISKILKVPINENLEELNEYPSKHLRYTIRRLTKRKSNQRLKKLKRFLKKISKERNENKTILIVAHGITNIIIIGYLSQLPLKKQLLRFSQDNTCLNILKWKEEYKNWNIDCVNDIEHLPLELRGDHTLR